MRIDAKILATGLFLNFDADQIDAIVAKANEISVARDGAGIESHTLPRESKESIIREAYRELEADKEAAEKPPLFSEDDLKKNTAAKAAFGKSPTLAARGLYIKAYGLDDYNRTLIEWGASPSNLNRGYRPKKLNAANTSNDDGDEPDKKKKPPADDGKKRGKNPFAADFAGTPEQALAARISLIKSGTQRAVSLAKAAGTDLAGRPLKVAP